MSLANATKPSGTSGKTDAGKLAPSGIFAAVYQLVEVSGVLQSVLKTCDGCHVVSADQAVAVVRVLGDISKLQLERCYFGLVRAGNLVLLLGWELVVRVQCRCLY